MHASPLYKQLDERLSETERIALQQVQVFAREVVAPYVASVDAKATLSRDIVRQWAALGMTRLQMPRCLGGMDGSYFSKVRIAQEIARISFACAFSLNNIQGVATRVARHGTDDQKSRYLAGLISGDCVGAFALTEPGAGSDLTAMTTTATKVDGGWVLNGEKSWVTNSALLDIALVLAQTGQGARDMATFIVDMSAAGVTRTVSHDTSVGALVGCGGIVLDDCRVGDENVIHQPGEAFKIALQGINGARLHVAAMCVAMLEAGLARAVDYCSTRQSFGKALLDHQGLRWQLADVATELEASNQLVIRGAQLIESGADATLMAAHAKRFCINAAQRGLEACVQAMGAQGVLDRYGLMRQLGEAKLAAYADGTTEMQTERIGQLLVRHYGSAASH